MLASLPPPPRRHVPAELDLGSVPALTGWYDELATRPLPTGDLWALEHWLRDWSEFESLVNEAQTRREVAMHRRTDDPDLLAAYLDWIDRVAPPCEPLRDRLARRLLAHPDAAALPPRLVAGDYGKPFVLENGGLRALHFSLGYALRRWPLGARKATEWGLTGWQRYDALNAALRMFKDWLQAFGGEENREPRKMVEQVQAWIQAHAGARLEDWRRPGISDTHAPRTMNRAGWKRPTAETNCLNEKDHIFEYLIYPSAFRSELCNGFDPSQVCKELFKRGLLCKGDGQNLSRKVREPGAAKPSRLYLIPPAILEWSDDHA